MWIFFSIPYRKCIIYYCVSNSEISLWKNYYSSSPVLKNLVKEMGKDEFKREILLLCKSNGELTYSETKYLFKNDVLESDLWFNDNIIGRYYSKNVRKYFL